MNLKSLRKKISVKYVEGLVKTDGGEEELRFPLLTSGDWGEFKDKTGVDIWDLLLSVSSGADSAQVAKMSAAEIEEYQRQTSLNLLKKIDQKSQVMMLYLSLRRDDEDVDIDDVDYIISYGMDQAEYIKVVNFLLYGVTSEKLEELKDDGGTKNAPKVKKASPTGTKEEQ